MEKIANVFIDIIGGLFKTVLTAIIPKLFSLFWDLIAEIVVTVLIRVLGVVLTILDLLMELFDTLAGLRNVEYSHLAGAASQFQVVNGVTTLTGDKVVVSAKITDIFAGYGPVHTAFWAMTAVGAGLTILFTIFAIYKSMAGSVLSGNEREQSSVGKTVATGLKTALTFTLLPAMLMLLLNITNAMLMRLNESLSVTDSGYAPTLGTVLFLIGTTGAEKGKEVPNPSFTDSYRIHYYRQEKGYTYMDFDQILSDFDAKKYEMPIVVIFTLGTFYVIGCTLILFIRRILELLALYVIAPLFACTIPLDEGKTFGKWKEMFVAKFFAGFGVVIIFKITYILIPFILSSQLSFNVGGGKTEMFAKMLFAVGGLYSALQSQHLIVQMLSYEAGLAAQETTATVLSGLHPFGGGGGGGGGGGSSSDSDRMRNAAASPKDISSSG